MKYRTIVADPPWDVKRPAGWGTTLNHRDQPYPTMAVGDISRLPVADLSAPDYSFLFLWTVNAYVEHSYSVARAWGYRPVNLLTWCKPAVGRQLGGAFTNTSEFILYCRRGSFPGGRAHLVDTTWFCWPRRGQSEKPEELQDLIEQHFSGPYLELFARRQRIGWDVWGNEVASHVELHPAPRPVPYHGDPGDETRPT